MAVKFDGTKFAPHDVKIKTDGSDGCVLLFEMPLGSKPKKLVFPDGQSIPLDRLLK